MTPELREFRKWNVVAGLIERISENEIEPVVLNIGEIALLIIREDKAFFFSSYPGDSITVIARNANTNEMISKEGPYDYPPTVTFREIAHLVLAKIVS
jgi:hypothetical protein